MSAMSAVLGCTKRARAPLAASEDMKCRAWGQS